MIQTATPSADRAFPSRLRRQARQYPGYLAEMLYQMSIEAPQSDINKDLWILRELATRCDRVTEMGVRGGVSTTAFLAAQPPELLSIDINECPNINTFYLAKGRTNFEFLLGDTLKIEIPATDLLFIDTYHVHDQLLAELRRHAPNTRKYIAMHDTISYGLRGEDGSEPGLIQAYNTFLHENAGTWRQHVVSFAQNGLTVLARVR